MLATPDYMKIRKWRNVERLVFYFSLRAASPEIKRRLEQLRPLFLQGMTNGKQLNAALDLWMAGKGISLEHRDEMDSEQRRLFYDTPIAKLLTPRIWEAAKEPSAPLHVSAAKLRSNDQPVNPATLAVELGISVATMYRRFGSQAVRDAWRFRADYSLPSDTSPITQTENEARRNEQIRRRAARFEVRV